MAGVLAAFLLATCGLPHAGARADETAARSAQARDEAAIRAIIADTAADRPNSHVSPALDWENAFGVRYEDLKKRNAFYGTVVAPLQKNDTDTTLEVKVRFIRPDVAVADEYWHIAGQLDVATHRPGPDRWGRTTSVFTRHGGQWTEVLERVADLRYAYYKHYDTLPKPAAVPAAILARYAGTYAFVDNHSTRVVAVAGDHLTVASATRTRVAIPVSATDFLLFDPADLAEYVRLHFVTDDKAGLKSTVTDEAGDVIGVLARTK
jgi:hypothetical protein